MRYLELTLESAAGNLACDEALLDACEEGSGAEVLRFWQPAQCFVVAGYSNEVEREVNLAACRQAGRGRVPALQWRRNGFARAGLLELCVGAEDRTAA